jgi:hypothetical protein
MTQHPGSWGFMAIQFQTNILLLMISTRRKEPEEGATCIGANMDYRVPILVYEVEHLKKEAKEVEIG